MSQTSGFGAHFVGTLVSYLSCGAKWNTGSFVRFPGCTYPRNCWRSCWIGQRGPCPAECVAGFSSICQLCARSCSLLRHEKEEAWLMRAGLTPARSIFGANCNWRGQRLFHYSAVSSQVASAALWGHRCSSWPGSFQPEIRSIVVFLISHGSSSSWPGQGFWG